MYTYQPIQFKPIAKEAKIVKLKKINNYTFSRPNKAITNLHDLNNISFTSISKPISNELQTTTSRFDSSFETSSSSFSTYKSSSDTEVYDTIDNDVAGEYLQKILVIKDYHVRNSFFNYSVRRGEYVYLISESDYYCLVENIDGVQGIIPKDICINLEETVRNAKTKILSHHPKITSV